VINYSDSSYGENGTSKSFKNSSIIKYRTHDEIVASPSDLINVVQDSAIQSIKNGRRVFTLKVKGITEEHVVNEDSENKVRDRKLKIEEILAAARKAKNNQQSKKRAIMKIDDLLKQRNRQKGTMAESNSTKNKVAMNIISSVSPLEFTFSSEENRKKEIKRDRCDEKEITYRVKRGDVLVRIAKRFVVSVSEIKKENNLKNSIIRVGQKLKIRVKNVEISDRKNGGIEIASLSSFGRNLDKPSGKIRSKGSRKGAKVSKKKSKRSSKRIFKWPIHGRISSKFGMRIHPIRKVWSMHTGIDIAARRGRLIRAAYSGKVIKSGWMGGYGKIVIIKHRNGYQTRYAHCSKLLVKKGQYVKVGQKIAKIGATGSATGPHVHFEVRKNGKPVNPIKYLK